ncbi:hypothetical protein B0H13DRAFT_1857362 [Mycena leptocephala]|nr:hypothetical protein B0H13DRAFT_1857362 [Mycena leptocephala]
MPPGKGPIWEFFFFPGIKQNSSHNQAHCLGCIRHFRQGLGAQDPPNDTDANLKLRLQWDEQIFVQARAAAGHVLGEKSAMIAHLIGRTRCPHASARATKIAKEIKKGKKQAAESDSESMEDEEEVRPTKKRKQVFRNVEKAMKQPELKVLPGSAEVEHLREQFLRATVPANLPFRWTEDVEVIKLFIMFRSTVCEVIPTRDVLSGTLLNAANSEVEKKLREALYHKYAMLSTRLEGRFSESNHWGQCYIRRKGSRQKRPWLLVVPCCAHQGQLMLGDYFAINDVASDVAEQATEAIHWISGHDRVKKIFDDAQFTKNFTVLVYLMANITRWNTHYLAFQRLISLKIPIRHAVYLQREEIVRAQVGAEKNKKAIAKITAAANKQCDVLESNEFWTALQTVVDDIEPICYATNINQAMPRAWIKFCLHLQVSFVISPTTPIAPSPKA